MSTTKNPAVMANLSGTTSYARYQAKNFAEYEQRCSTLTMEKAELISQKVDLTNHLVQKDKEVAEQNKLLHDLQEKLGISERKYSKFVSAYAASSASLAWHGCEVESLKAENKALSFQLTQNDKWTTKQDGYIESLINQLRTAEENLEVFEAVVHVQDCNVLRGGKSPALIVLELPELLEAILAHPPACDVLLWRRVCRRWRDIVKTSPTLQQKLFFSAKGPFLHLNINADTGLGNSGSGTQIRFVDRDSHLWEHGIWLNPLFYVIYPATSLAPSIEFVTQLSRNRVKSMRSGPWEHMYLTSPATEQVLFDIDVLRGKHESVVESIRCEWLDASGVKLGSVLRLMERTLKEYRCDHVKVRVLGLGQLKRSIEDLQIRQG